MFLKRWFSSGTPRGPRNQISPTGCTLGSAAHGVPKAPCRGLLYHSPPEIRPLKAELVWKLLTVPLWLQPYFASGYTTNNLQWNRLRSFKLQVQNIIQWYLRTSQSKISITRKNHDHENHTLYRRTFPPTILLQGDEAVSISTALSQTRKLKTLPSQVSTLSLTSQYSVKTTVKELSLMTYRVEGLLTTTDNGWANKPLNWMFIPLSNLWLVSTLVACQTKPNLRSWWIWNSWKYSQTSNSREMAWVIPFKR